ncbi:glycosyltransferase family 2 protein [Raineyella sp. LH-20]|uniref:glycosyltransferase family 2 protein n=1 Tax=Raineyella sp. LH-20 TaxID=3081204 RepID=UPI0029557F80|nr:glycosyltransferase family 2 protein [Raineyella sp. LH-20]WOP19848.1 glycosyltransferase family 2 protein [Raineyella sp. LH-20]
MSPLVSAVVPFCGVEEYIRPCLDSIRRQTLTDFEVVLVDDGSRDRSAEIAAEVCAADSRFRMVSQERGGPGPARNLGVGQATGRYLMFVDSDDLLAPRAFAQLATSLEESGSDVAGAHVWRLGLQRGLETSWAHREPFAERLQRTSIREVPLLMRDRMVWNKMWRRTFWDDHGFAFPAMLFEDYPIAMRAHLEAAAVDLLPDPVYVWRERPSGDSISQQGDQVHNVRDRVTAAVAVLDLVDERGDDELRELVHSHFVDVDVREVLGSLVAAAPADRSAMRPLAAELVDRIDPEQVALAVPDLRRAYVALRMGDVEQALAIGRYRAGDRAPEVLAAAGKTVRPLPARAVHTGLRVARRAVPSRPRQARLADLTVLPHAFHYRLTVPLPKPLAMVATARVTIGSVRPAVKASPLPGGLQLDVTVDTADLARLAAITPLRIAVQAGPLSWAGGVAVTEDQLHGVRRAGYWVQAVLRDGALAFSRVRRVPVIDRLDLGDATVRVHTVQSSGAVVVERPWPTPPVEAPIIDHVALIAVDALLSDDPADDPVGRTATRRVLVRRDGSAEAEPAVLSGPGIATVVAGREGAGLPGREGAGLPGREGAGLGGRRLRWGRDADGRAVLTHGPALP